MLPAEQRSFPHFDSRNNACRCLDPYLYQYQDLPEELFPLDEAIALRLIRQISTQAFSFHPKRLFSHMRQLYATNNCKLYIATTPCGFRIAIKKLKIQSNPVLQSYVDLEAALSLLCAPCPQVVDILFSVRTGQNVWLAMEWMDWGSIANVRASFFMEEAIIAYVLKQVLLGLKYMHGRYRLHRDIKAHNVLVNARGEIKLADFGWAIQLTRAHDRTALRVGSVLWMAPELHTGVGYSFPADMWSVGILAIELACKLPPYHHLENDDVATLTVFGPVPALQSYPAPDCPYGPDRPWSDVFLSFIQCCLQKDPMQRATVSELLSHPFIFSAVSHPQWCAWLAAKATSKCD